MLVSCTLWCPAVRFRPDNKLLWLCFSGSHVVIYLVERYPAVRIVCLDKLDYCSSAANLKPIETAKNYTFVQGDILDADLVNDLLRRYAIDTIVHFAAQTHVDNSFGNSLHFTWNNTVGTHTLLESARHCVCHVM